MCSVVDLGFMYFVINSWILFVVIQHAGWRGGGAVRDTAASFILIEGFVVTCWVM
jgi:hypothetical protein